MTSDTIMGNEEEASRSAFVHMLIRDQAKRAKCDERSRDAREANILPKKILQYWHDPSDLPDDVRECMESWERLKDEGYEYFLHGDTSAAEYITEMYGMRERNAFLRCAHPAMRCDYLRLCFIVKEGGLYVDADDVLVGEDWPRLFDGDKLKLQPLCYDIAAGGMMSAPDIWREDIGSDGRNFYINNNPLVAPAEHPLLVRALDRATRKLLSDDRFPEIQGTTGPGNMTIALVAHAKYLLSCGKAIDFELLRDWESVAEMRWQLSYRDDERNWRNVYGC